MAKRRSRWANQAAMEALVRYGPEESGLNEMQRQATTDLQTSIAQARGTAQGVVSMANAARPGVAKIYDQAGLNQARTAHTLEGDTAQLGGVANSIKAGAALEQTVGLRHLRESKASALTDLSQRAVAAKEGQTWATRKAQDDFASTIAQVLGRKIDLAREKGAFTASTLDSLLQSDMDRKQQLAIANARLTQSERNSLRSAGIDPDTGRPIPNGRLDPHRKTGSGGSGRFNATRAQIASAQDAYSQTRGLAVQLKQAGLSRADASVALLHGRDAAPVYQTVTTKDPRTGKVTTKQVRVLNKDGTPKTRSAVEPAKSALLLTAALDMAYMGHLSRDTARKLRDRGLHPKQIGDVTLYSEWRRNRRSRTPVEQGPMTSGSTGPHRGPYS